MTHHFLNSSAPLNEGRDLEAVCGVGPQWRMRGSAEMTPEEIRRFDIASSHPYECKCELCKEWWANVPPEDDECKCELCKEWWANVPPEDDEEMWLEASDEL